MLITWRGYFHQYDADGQVVMHYPDVVDADGQRVLDPAADPVLLTHPITHQPLLDPAGQPRRASDARQPALQDLDAGHPLQVPIAWPWYAPIGGLFAFVLGYLLADPKPRDPVSRPALLGV